MNRIFSYSLGIILLATAFLKLWMLLTDPFADIKIGFPTLIIWFSVGVEFWVAYQNFRSSNSNWLSLLNTGLFSVFFLVSAIRWQMGYRSCGCTGALEVPSWIVLCFDCGVLALLVFSQNSRRCIANGWRELTSGFSKTESASTWLGWTCGIGMVFIAYTFLASPEPLQIVAERINLGKTEIDCKQTVVINLVNKSDNEAKVLGATTSCTCVSLEDRKPFRLAPNSTKQFRIEVTPLKPGFMHQRVVFYLDSPQQNVVAVDVYGSVF